MEIPARHPRKGDCVIREVTTLLGRVKVLVDYPDLGLFGRPEYLDELIDRRTGARVTVEPPARGAAAPPANSAPTPTWQSARQTLLALRLGQSTIDSVRDLSVGMEEVDEACQWAIGRAQTGQLSFLLFESPYGMGKSHALGHLKLTARQSSMATGGVVLDGVAVSLCLPMSLIGALAHSVEYPDGTASDGLPQRLAGLVVRGEVEKLRTYGARLLYGSVVNLRPEQVQNPDIWEVIEDYLSLELSANQINQRFGLRVQPLRAHFREDRPARCADLLREWAQACSATGAGGGLTVLLDEADVDYAQGGRAETDREQRAIFLQALRQNGDGGPKGESYGRLLVALAVTPGAGKSDPIEELKTELGPHLRIVKLKELSMDQLSDLGLRVASLYRRAYEITGDEDKAEKMVRECLQITDRQVEERNPRLFIRLLLEKLDVLYA